MCVGVNQCQDNSDNWNDQKYGLRYNQMNERPNSVPCLTRRGVERDKVDVASTNTLHQGYRINAVHAVAHSLLTTIFKFANHGVFIHENDHGEHGQWAEEAQRI